MQHNRPKWLELVNHPDFVALYNTWPGNEVAALTIYPANESTPGKRGQIKAEVINVYKNSFIILSTFNTLVNLSWNAERALMSIHENGWLRRKIEIYKKSYT